jgi:hypothetical protein
MVDIYEYYDDYEHIWRDLPESNRIKVRYFVVGSTCDHTIICYTGTLPYVTKISTHYHNDAWIAHQITIKQAIEYLKRDVPYQNTTSIDTKIQDILSKKSYYDDLHNLKTPSTSRSISVGNITIHYRYGESFTDEYIKALNSKRELLIIRDNYLDQLLTQYAEEQFHNRKATIIQNYFRESNTNPSYYLCTKRLLTELKLLKDNSIYT